ncbi:DUF1836 domain-containing protein [Bacillus sp. B15-48]|uniref:DUF1836 domain-containing protein n=1 Tax=Bacillus sp. B15-48 TaxID=1548601 RepID=UPI00193ED985|nr:DUF1836 domain-containing protein [Bacillus sp. B15-48]MBM4765235.1 DUF1836 domain-containing protein [Bacillus sp. B15-48]
MEQLNEVIKEMDLNQNIHLEDIPNIDLYMDQVIQLFEKTYNQSKRDETDKILTKTMINNYAKGKLLFPVKNKKYSKEHIMLLSLIYHLKGSLSIVDIKELLGGLNEEITTNDMELDRFYQSYLTIFDGNVESFTKELEVKGNAVHDQMQKFDKDTQYLEKLLLITSLVNMSNFYRKTAEKLVDSLKEKKQ